MNTNFNLNTYESALLEEQKNLIKDLSAELEKNPEDKLTAALLYLVKRGGLHR